MRTFYLILSFVCLCDLLHAQTVRIAYEGDPLTDKERQKIAFAICFMHKPYESPMKVTRLRTKSARKLN